MAEAEMLSVESIIDRNPSIPDEFLEPAAAAVAKGCPVEKLYCKVFRITPDNVTGAYVGDWPLLKFSMDAVGAAVRRGGEFKAELRGRSGKINGCLRVVRFELDERFEPAAAPAPAPVLPAPVPGLPIAGGSVLETLLLRMLDQQQQRAPVNPIESAVSSIELLGKLAAAAKVLTPAVPQTAEIVDGVTAKLARLAGGEAGAGWLALAERLVDHLPRIVEHFSRGAPPPAARVPAEAAAVGESGGAEEAAENPRAEVLRGLGRALMVGVLARSDPDPYAALVADAVRLGGEIATFVAAPRGAWTDEVLRMTPALDGDRSWVIAVEDMARAEFVPAGDDDEPANPLGKVGNTGDTPETL